MDSKNLNNKIHDLRKAVDSNRRVWRGVLESVENKWRERIEAKTRRITALKKEMTAESEKWEARDRAIARELEEARADCAARDKIIGDITAQVEASNTKIKTASEKLEALKENFDAVSLDKNVEIKELKTREANQKEANRILQTRLIDGQKRWDDVLQMKDKDYGVIRRELELKAKEWQGEYQKDEEEIEKARLERTKLEAKLEAMDTRLRDQELRAREQVGLRDDQISTLKREFQLQEEKWDTRLKEKEAEVASIVTQMTEFHEDMEDILPGEEDSGKTNPAPEAPAELSEDVEETTPAADAPAQTQTAAALDAEKKGKKWGLF